MLSEAERCDSDEGQGYSVMVALKWKVSGKERGLRGKEAHCLSCGMCLESACMSQGERCLEDDEDQKVCVEFRVFCNCRYSGLAGSGVS